MTYEAAFRRDDGPRPEFERARGPGVARYMRGSGGHVITPIAERLTIRMQPVTGTDHDPPPYVIEVPLAAGTPGG
jgi:hypothetical protein